MSDRFTGAVKAHKNVIIAAIAVTGLLGYVLPGSLPAAQATWLPEWWSSFISAFSSAESDASGGDAEAESGDATAVQALNDVTFDNDVEQTSATVQTNDLDDRDDVTVTQANVPVQEQVGLYGNVNTQEIGDLVNAANVETGGNAQANVAVTSQEADNSIELENEAETGDAFAIGGDAEADAEAEAED